MILIPLIPKRVYAMNVLSFDNGLQTIFEKREHTGVVTAQIWVKVGSKYEDKKTAGITHFIEHLIFKGTKKLKSNVLATRIESLGGSINAFTSYDNTVYHIIIPKKSFEEGLELLIESVKNPVFPEEEIEKERRVVLEEIKMGEDDVQRKLFNELFSVSYQGHPYGRPIIGFNETVKSITRTDIIQYYKTHYTPDNITVVVVGDFEEQKTREIIGKQFGKKMKIVQNRITHIPVVQENKNDVLVLEKDVRENYLAFSYVIPPINHKDIAALEILGTILADGESSRLTQSLKQRMGVVTNISSYVFSPKEEGLFVLYATFKNKEYEPVLREIDKELENIKIGPISAWEIEKAKNMIKASYIYSEETVQGKARQIGNFQTLTGDPAFLDTFLKGVDEVNEASIKEVFAKYIEGKDRKLVFLKAKKGSNPYTLELPNGMKCIVNKNKAAPSLSFKIGFVGGLKEEPKGKNGIFNILSRMLLKGTKGKDASSIAREIDFLAGDMSPFNGRNLFGMSGKFLKKDLKESLSLLNELLTDTFLREEELAKVKEEVLSDIRQRDDAPVGYTFKRFNEVLYKGHPYSMDPRGVEKDVEGVTIEDLKVLHKRFVSPSNTVIAISGDVDEKQLFSIITELFAPWSGEKNLLRSQIIEPARREASIEKDIMQTHMVFGFLAPGLLDNDRYAIEVMDSILSGMGGRIHRVLREENPYAYALTFFNQMAYEVSGMGIYIGTDIKYVKDVERIVKEEITKIIEKGFTDKEVNDGKSYLIGNHYISMQSNGAMTTSMCFDTMYGLPPNHFKLYPSYIEKITRQDVNRVARKYFSLEKMVQVSVGKVDK
jgi:zinc protease